MMIQTIQCVKKHRVPYFRLTSERHLSSAFSCQRTSLQSLSITGTRSRTAMSSSKWKCTPKIFPSSGFQLLDPSWQIEEESLPTYCPEKYYPVRQGEVFNDRYQILAKLGYGVTSTVWFSRDLVDAKYVVLKIYVTVERRNHELDIYHHIDSVESRHPGRRFIRILFDHFLIRGPHGQHVCLVHEPLGVNASELLRCIPGQGMSLESLKPCIRQLLVVLEFLHSEAHIIDTDLQLKNLLLPTPSLEALSEFEEREIKEPSARKVLNDRIIYMSSRFPTGAGLPLLSDFGEARFGDGENNADIMPNPYRAPEVILKSNWDYKVDIWNIAMLAWDIVSPRPLIVGRNTDGVFDDRVHLAELVALLGPPSPEFLECHHLSSVFWGKSGKWKYLVPIPGKTLESLATNIRGEDKEEFLRWLRLALQWNPADGPTFLDLLYDEWMMKGLKLGQNKQTSSEV